MGPLEPTSCVRGVKGKVGLDVGLIVELAMLLAYIPVLI